MNLVIKISVDMPRTMVDIDWDMAVRFQRTRES